MSKPNESYSEICRDRVLLREHVEFTARQTGFHAKLVEKDFYCSVILQWIASQLPPTVVFKGGTSLSKIYTEFYRMSEDLDFTIPVPLDAKRTLRRKLIEPVKRISKDLTTALPEIKVIETLRGANESTQYLGTWGYDSVISGTVERVKVEFGLREPAMLPAQVGSAKTLILNALTAQPLLHHFPVSVMALTEVWAEKTRAALARLEPAIRDFFDLNHALQVHGLDLSDKKFVELVAQKLAVPGTGPVDITERKFIILERQTEGELRPVLRQSDFACFDLRDVWALLRQMTERLRSEGKIPEI